jgi:hypothetical protein
LHLIDKLFSNNQTDLEFINLLKNRINQIKINFPINVISIDLSYNDLTKLPENNCFSHKKLQDLNLPMPETVDYSEKIKVYGKECKAIENNYNECIWKKDGIPIARRSFYCDAILNMSQYDEKGVFDLQKSIETIRSSVFKSYRYRSYSCFFCRMECARF